MMVLLLRFALFQNQGAINVADTQVLSFTEIYENYDIFTKHKMF